MESSSSANGIHDLKSGDHACFLFKNENEHRDVVIPYIIDGLERNEKVVYITSEHPASVLIDQLEELGYDVEEYAESGQLVFIPSDVTYLRLGEFDMEEMLAQLTKLTEEALEMGFSGLRIAGEMGWALRDGVSSTHLIEYESKVNDVLKGKECVALCVYDQSKYDPETLLDVLATHPIAIMGNRIHDNIYYVPPERFLVSDRPAITLEHWMENLSGREVMERRIHTSLKEKELLLKEIHHRVKNNMQIVTSLVRLQAKHAKDTTVQFELRETHDRIKSMALIHEKLYTSRDFGHINFATYCQNLGLDVMQSYDIDNERVRYSVKGDHISLSLDLAIPCGLIVNELVSNCAKHAFPDERSGGIKVELDDYEDYFTITVIDDGIGIPHDIDIHSATTLGAEIIMILVDQLDAELDIENSNGTTVTVKIPHESQY